MISSNQFPAEFQPIAAEIVRQRETDFLGEVYLQYVRAVGQQARGLRAIGNLTNYVLAATRAQMRREEQPTGFVSLDDDAGDGLPLAETIAAPEEVEFGASCTRLAGEAVEELLDLHQQGTADLAKRLGCTRRSVQQKLKARAEAMLAAVQGGEVVQGELWGGA